MVRTPRYDKSELKKGAWSPEEDKKLIEYVTRFGHKNWRQLPKSAGLARCGKSCRLRWKNYLRPDVKRGNYTQEEEETIVKLHAKFGNRWSLMASQLTGRSDNEIKNHWHTHLKKRLQHISVSTNEKSEEASKSRHHTPLESRQDNMDYRKTTSDPFNNNSPASSQSHTPDFSSSPQQLAHSAMNDFLFTTLEPSPLCDTNLAQNDECANFMDSNIELKSEDFWTGLYANDYSYFPGELLDSFVTESECSSPVYDVSFWGL